MKSSLIDTSHWVVENVWVTNREYYHLAAAAVWGIILGKALGIIDYGNDGRIYLGENGLLAMTGLITLMHGTLTVIKKAVLARKARKEKVDGQDSGNKV